jgi:hypothetical protein
LLSCKVYWRLKYVNVFMLLNMLTSGQYIVL